MLSSIPLVHYRTRIKLTHLQCPRRSTPHLLHHPPLFVSWLCLIRSVISPPPPLYLFTHRYNRKPTLRNLILPFIHHLLPFVSHSFIHGLSLHHSTTPRTPSSLRCVACLHIHKFTSLFHSFPFILLFTLPALTLGTVLVIHVVR